MIFKIGLVRLAQSEISSQMSQQSLSYSLTV